MLILNLGQRFRREFSLKMIFFSNLSSGGNFVQWSGIIYKINRGHYGEHFCERRSILHLE